MAHTYVIASLSRVGDIATVTGTVDGQAVTVQVNWSSLLTFPNATAAQTFIAAAMLAALPPVPVNVTTYNGTFTQ